jgi:Icc-related predicted phosphoesterase
MKIAIASDLHFDFYSPENQVKIANKFKDIYNDVDYIVLAGDLVNGLNKENVAALNLLFDFEGLNNKIIFVPGNHDYWGLSEQEFLDALTMLNILILNNDILSFNKIKMFGGTLWFPKHPEMLTTWSRWCDFEYVTPINRIFDSNTDFVHSLMAFKDNSPPQIVISHHAPSLKSVHPKFQRSKGNFFFATDMDQLILTTKPLLWIHGHTHTPFDYLVGDTRVICNPLGYPGEGKPIDDWFPKIVEID